MGKKKNETSGLSEKLNDKVCEFISMAILEMLAKVKMRGYDAIAILVTVLVDVIYTTAVKKGDEQWKHTIEGISDHLMKGLKMYEKSDKEEDDEQGEIA